MNKKSIICTTLFTALTLTFSPTASAEKCKDSPIEPCLKHTVITKTVKFKSGTTGASYSGAAEYGMSYVYNLRAKTGQNASIKLRSKAAQVRFSLIYPSDATAKDGFNVDNWSGTLPESGNYSIVIVMNNQKISKVPFKLEFEVK